MALHVSLNAAGVSFPPSREYAKGNKESQDNDFDKIAIDMPVKIFCHQARRSDFKPLERRGGDGFGPVPALDRDTMRST